MRRPRFIPVRFPAATSVNPPGALFPRPQVKSGDAMSPNEPSSPSTVVDLAILGRLVEEHRAKLVAMVRRRMDPVLAAKVGAEDVVNEAFLVARRKWSGFEERSAA